MNLELTTDEADVVAHALRAVHLFNGWDLAGDDREIVAGILVKLGHRHPGRLRKSRDRYVADDFHMLTFVTVCERLDDQYAWVERGASNRFDVVVEDRLEPVARRLTLRDAYERAVKINEERRA